MTVGRAGCNSWLVESLRNFLIDKLAELEAVVDNHLRILSRLGASAVSQRMTGVVGSKGVS